MDVHLVEPEARGHVSGGYLYNERMCATAGFTRHAARVDALVETLVSIPAGPHTLLVADSLFYTRAGLAPFLAARAATGCRLAILVHAFPSFVERASQRATVVAAQPLLPTTEEVELAAEVDFLISPGPAVARQLAQCDSRASVVIGLPGTDAPATPGTSSSRGRDPGLLRIVTVGGVSANKGLLDGVDALDALRDRNWTWTIVGSLERDAAAASALRQAVDRRALSQRVHLAGQLGRDAVWKALRASDAFLFPSYTENYPLVAAEALAARCPVVGYAVGGVPDIVTDEQDGLLAPPCDVDGLTQRLRRLLDDPNALAQLQGGCERARPLPSWEQAARDLQRALWARVHGAPA